MYDPPQPYLVKLYQAILSTAYFGLFRIGKLTEGPHVMAVKDVKVAMNKQKIMFVLRTSKTHWCDIKPQIITITATPLVADNAPVKIRMFCPFQLLRNYIKARRTRASKCSTEQFFIFRDRSAVKPEHVRKVLKEHYY